MLTASCTDHNASEESNVNTAPPPEMMYEDTIVQPGPVLQDSGDTKRTTPPPRKQTGKRVVVDL